MPKTSKFRRCGDCKSGTPADGIFCCHCGCSDPDLAAASYRARFHANKDVRWGFNVKTDDANSAEYKNGMKKYVDAMLSVDAKDAERRRIGRR